MPFSAVFSAFVAFANRKCHIHLKTSKIPVKTPLWTILIYYQVRLSRFSPDHTVSFLIKCALLRQKNLKHFFQNVMFRKNVDVKMNVLSKTSIIGVFRLFFSVSLFHHSLFCEKNIFADFFADFFALVFLALQDNI